MHRVIYLHVLLGIRYVFFRFLVKRRRVDIGHIDPLALVPEVFMVRDEYPFPAAFLSLLYVNLFVADENCTCKGFYNIPFVITDNGRKLQYPLCHHG